MFCSQCGKPTKQGQNFCRFCGAPLQQKTNSDSADDSVFEPAYKESIPSPTQGNSDLQQNSAPSPELSDEFSASTQELSSQTPMKMAWYRFLIYFSLFAGAFINFLTSLSLLMGRYYTNKKTTEFLYNMYDDLRSLDILMALLLIMISAWGIFTRFRLARYRKNGPLYLNIHYGSSIAWCLIFIYSLSSITNVSPTEIASAYIPSIIAGIILIVTNTLYFQKRKHLFIR